MDVFERLESEVRGYARAFPTVFSTAQGSELRDEHGRSYLDFFAGSGALNYGHNHPGLRESAVEYLMANGVVHGMDMATSARRRFIEAFEEIILLPRQLQYKLQFPGPGGADAIEAALQLARRYTGRSGIIAFSHGYHGLTQGALACTANRRYRAVGAVPPASGVNFMPYDGYFGPDIDTLALLRTALTDPASGVDKPAAILLETVQGEGGIHVADSGWLQGLAGLCREQGIVFIIDDIQAGCGRTGPFFSFERAGIAPDIVVLSKSLSGNGLPLAMLLLKPEMDVWESGQHTTTFGGNNLAFVTARTALELFWRDEALAQETEQKGALIEKRLNQLVRAYPGQLSQRGAGMMRGLVFADAALAAEARTALFEERLLVEGCGSDDRVVKVCPALTITAGQLEEGLSLLEMVAGEVVERALKILEPAHA